MSLPGEHINYYKLFKAAPSLFLILDTNLKILGASDAYLKATKTTEDIFGRGLFEVFPDNPEDDNPSGVSNLNTSLQRVIKTGKADTMAVQKYDIPLPGGQFEEKYWSPHNSPVLDENGKVEYIIHRVDDVTEFIQLKKKGSEQHLLTEQLRSQTEKMEGEIYQRAQELQDMNKKLLEAEQVKSEFFANVSHELRTPLSLIVAPLESLLSENAGSLNQQQTQFVHTIHNNAVRLLQMINGLLDFSKFEAGKMTVSRSSVNVQRLVQSALSDFGPMMNTKNIRLSCETDLKNPNVSIDQYLFERILFNLLSNAFKFSNDGGSIKVLVKTYNDSLKLVVQDSGIGIPEDELANLFRKFYQVESSSIRRFEGTGLGLAMVKEFAGLLGGTVSIESKVGKGSTFTVECEAPPAEEMSSVSSSSSTYRVPLYNVTGKTAALAEDDPKKPKLLVCEDNPELATYVSSLLAKYCNIKLARNGEEGLQLVYTWQPDLVLTDVMMPDKDGIELCRSIKADPETTKTTVVLLTALTQRDAMLRGWKAGADEYLFKPFHPEELVTRIRTLLASIAERKKAAELIEQKNTELSASNAELESFNYYVSHDLRAPLRAINGYTRILASDFPTELNDELRRILNAVLHNTEKMGQLIDDLLAFSRLGRQEVKKTEVDMTALANKVMEEIKTNEPDYKAQIQLHSLPSTVADPNLMQQVLTNLFSNALKYSKYSTKPTVEVGSKTDNGNHVYYVKDNGVGFDMKYYDKLFGVFNRLHSSPQYEGTGVGLALSKRIIDKHGGRIWADAKEGEGATFYFMV